MNAREVEAAASNLARSRKRVGEAAAIAAGCGVVALATWPVALALALAFGAGAGAGVLVAIAGALARREKIARLAVDPYAYELPEVSRYAMRLTRGFERQRLADWIVEILDEGPCLPEAWYLPARVVRYADELAALSNDLADPRAQILPASIAAAHQLLTQAVDSPLYNPALPADQLPATIAKIRLGISRAPA